MPLPKSKIPDHQLALVEIGSLWLDDLWHAISV